MEESPVRRFSVLVRLMQFLGIFSYVWPNSPPDASPRQSFGLCLWAMLLQLVYLGLGSFSAAVLFDKELPNDLGELLQLCIDIFCLFLPNVMLFLMVIKGRNLANLFSRIEETLDEAVKLRMNSWLTSKVKAFTMALGIVPLVLSVINVYYEGMTELYMTPLRIMKETAMSSVYVLQMGLFVLILYFLSTFVNHLVRDAVASTQTAELQLWRASAQVKDEAWCQQQMSQLLHLELRLRKVQAMKSLLLDFFGWPLVVAMLQTLIIIIAGFYNFTRINYRFIQLLSMTLCGFLTLILFSGVGENFKNKILASVDLLRDYSALSPHLPLKTQVQRLCEQLEAMAPVTLQGMVTLGYANIPSMLTLVATYLVVLLQMGEIPTFSHLSPNETKSS